jgi:hypothetical protein
MTISIKDYYIKPNISTLKLHLQLVILKRGSNCFSSLVKDDYRSSYNNKILSTISIKLQSIINLKSNRILSSKNNLENFESINIIIIENICKNLSRFIFLILKTLKKIKNYNRKIYLILLLLLIFTYFLFI